jgi:Rrf2 family protein
MSGDSRSANNPLDQTKPMSLLPRKAIFGVAAIVDIAIHAHKGPMRCKELGARYHLSPRYFEAMLQSLAREGILDGKRGRYGGYRLARDLQTITAEDIFRILADVDEQREESFYGSSALLEDVITEALLEVEEAFSRALKRVNLQRLAYLANKIEPDGERVTSASAIPFKAPIRTS